MWPPPPWPQLALRYGPHPIQDDGAGLKGCQRNCTYLPPNTGETTRPSGSTRSSTAAGQLVPLSIRANKSHTDNSSQTLLCIGTSLVEQTPSQCQGTGITLHLPQKTQDFLKVFFFFLQNTLLYNNYVSAFRLFKHKDSASQCSILPSLFSWKNK